MKVYYAAAISMLTAVSMDLPRVGKGYLPCNWPVCIYFHDLISIAVVAMFTV